MNPKAVAELMGELASRIANKVGIDAVGILTLEGEKICCFFGDGKGKKMDEACMVSVLQVCSKYFAVMAKRLQNGEVSPEKLGSKTEMIKGVFPEEIEKEMTPPDEDNSFSAAM